MSTSKRLISLDVLRGITIAGMILVNVPGSWEHIYWPFRHAAFNGLTLADLVFPFFLYIVGASIVLALGKRVESNAPKKELVLKVVKRTFIIFGIGVFLNWMSSDFTFPLRIAGVLQRIAFCYFAGSMLFIYTSRMVWIVVGLILLLGYWVLTLFIPIPGLDEVVFTPEMNWAAWVDGKLLPGKMYFGNWDPEGILSTFPAIVSTICGMLAASVISKLEEKKQKVVILMIGGTGLLIAGLLLSASFPINKNVWSSSFVMVTSGLATIIWAVFIYIIDMKNWVSWTFPWICFGANAITAYVLHYLLFYPLGKLKLGGFSFQQHFMTFFSEWMSTNLASLLWAVLYTFICFLPVWYMYKKKIFVKI